MADRQVLFGSGSDYRRFCIAGRRCSSLPCQMDKKLYETKTKIIIGKRAASLNGSCIIKSPHTGKQSSLELCSTKNRPSKVFISNFRGDSFCHDTTHTKFTYNIFWGYKIFSVPLQRFRLHDSQVWAQG